MGLGSILGGLAKTALGSIAGGAGNLVGGALDAKAAKDVAKINADAQAQDQRQTGVSNEFFQQLQQSLSQMDKSVVEKLFGTSNTADVMSQLQTMQQEQQTDQTQTTIRGDAGANQAVLSNILGLSEQFGTGGAEAMDAAINKVLRSGAGAIAGVGNRSGTFGDTTTALLQNDLVTRAGEAGVLAESQRQGQMSSSIAQLMASLQGGQETTTGKQATTTAGNTNTSGTNTSNTTTTQDRTANEAATESNATSTTGQSNATTDTFTDFAKDPSQGMGSKNPNVLPTLGQNIGNAPQAPTNVVPPSTLPGAQPNPLANVNLVGLAPKTNAIPNPLDGMVGNQATSPMSGTVTDGTGINQPAQAITSVQHAGAVPAAGQPTPSAQPSPIAGIALPTAPGMPTPEQLASLGLTPEMLAQLQAGQPGMTTGVWNPPKAQVM